jgi:hypothetical protein
MSFLILCNVLLERLHLLDLAFVMFVLWAHTVFLVHQPVPYVPPGPVVWILRMRLFFVLKAFSP